jgi:hypothetical protein
MRRLLLLLSLFIGGCSLSGDVELLKLRNEIVELRDVIEKNNQLDQQNWLLDIYRQKQLEVLNKDLKQRQI